MSMGLAVYAVPTDLAAQVVGSRSRAVVNRVLRHAGNFASVDGHIRVRLQIAAHKAMSHRTKVLLGFLLIGVLNI